MALEEAGFSTVDTFATTRHRREKRTGPAAGCTAAALASDLQKVFVSGQIPISRGSRLRAGGAAAGARVGLTS